MYSNNNSNSECGQFGSTNSSSFQTTSQQYQAYQTTDNIGYFGSYYDPYSQYGYNTAYNNGYFYQAYQPTAYSQVPTSTYHQSTATFQDPMASSVQQQPQDSPAQYTSDVAPQSTKHDSTPEKPIMNDSGVDFISPTILQTSSSSSSNVTPSVYTPPVTSNEEESDFDESIEEEEDENKENEESSKQGKSKNGKKTSSDSNLPSKPPKPYLEIIANAVLSSPVKMMQLHEIYAYMESKYSYFLMNVNKSWRNSVRHNLSLNECFIKAARGTNGKGNYWRIHPLCEREFIRGNFRRKTFKQLIRAGGQQRQQHQQQQMSLPYPASFGSIPLNYSVGMFPPPPPTISANMFAGENKQLQNNSVHYRPY